MTTNETMPDVIWTIPHGETCNGGWDDTKWIPCPYVENDTRPENETKYLRADTVSAAVREVEQAIANQTKTMRGIAALIKGRGYDMISAEDQEEAWMREALRLERATDKALAALRGLGE